MERRVALITGGSQGFGLAVGRTLARGGWRLIIDARRADVLAGAEAELSALTEVDAIAGDITDPAHRSALAGAVARAGRLDLVVNNASTLGASPLPSLEGLDLDTLRRIFEVNVVAPLAVIQQLLPALDASHGTVVNVSSDAAVEAYEGWGGYGSSKAALEQLSAVLAAEHPDLRVLWIDPGDMRTEMHQAAFPGEDIADRPLPDLAAERLVALLAQEGASGRHRLEEVPT